MVDKVECNNGKPTDPVIRTKLLKTSSASITSMSSLEMDDPENSSQFFKGWFVRDYRD
jgi:hypothetical protein